MLSCEGKQGHALLYLEGDPTITQKYGLIPSNKREEIYRRRRERVNDICAQTIVSLEQGYGIGVKLGRWMLRPLTGIPILLFCLWLMYEFVGVFISGTVEMCIRDRY